MPPTPYYRTLSVLLSNFQGTTSPRVLHGLQTFPPRDPRFRHVICERADAAMRRVGRPPLRRAKQRRAPRAPIGRTTPASAVCSGTTRRSEAVSDRGASGEAWSEMAPAVDWAVERPPRAPVDTAGLGPHGPRHADDVAGAFVSVALARLERDHVALLAAVCELTSPSGDRGSATDMGDQSALREALLTVLREDLLQTQRALALAANGAYGYCEVCHTLLPSRVLLEQPATTRCVGCASSLERVRQIH
jgi:RNA polymerase-binding transcription factor DksA